MLKPIFPTLGSSSELNAGVDDLEIPRVEDLGTAAFMNWDVIPMSVFPLPLVAAYQLVPADRGKVVFATHAVGFTVTLPLAVDVMLGWVIPIKASGAGNITVAAGAGNTVDGAASVIIATGTTKWFVRDTSTTWLSF